MSEITAIETWYGGHRMRSRLEARYAVFMDALGVKWEYEKEGYKFTEGDDTYFYLPDFWLPELQQWVEIKGVVPSIVECHLCDKLAQTGYPVIILWGNIMEQKAYYWLPGDYAGYTNWFECLDCGLIGLAPGQIRDECTCERRDTYAPSIRNAYIAARAARFEYGERGFRFEAET